MQKLERILVNGFPAWARPEWMQQGVAHGFFDSEFDAGSSVGFHDSPVLAEQIKLGLLTQIHGTDIVECVDSTNEIIGDAWLVQLELLHVKRIALGIRTADCVPVLVYHPRTGLVGAAHCGWRGAAAGLLPKLIRRMNVLGAINNEIELAFGPAARNCCYEVKSDVIRAFKAAANDGFRIENASKNILRHRCERVMLDVTNFLIAEALSLGALVGNIFTTTECTICSEQYFSFRRQGKLAGRQLSFIGSQRQ